MKLYELKPLNFFINIDILDSNDTPLLNTVNASLYEVTYKLMKQKQVLTDFDWAEEIAIPGVKC